MTEFEKADIFMRYYELKQEGKIEEATALHRTMPLSPHLAMCMKKYQGVEHLLNSGWNLAEAEAEFGSDWLNR